MIKLVMCLGDFPIELVATNFTDVNECADGTSNCSADAVCINTKGSYRCKCKTGSTGEFLVQVQGMDGLAKVKQSL